MVWFLLVASWPLVSEGNLAKLSRQLILNLTDVICFLRGQESADLNLFWSPLGVELQAWRVHWVDDELSSWGGRNRDRIWLICTSFCNWATRSALFYITCCSCAVFTRNVMV